MTDYGISFVCTGKGTHKQRLLRRVHIRLVEGEPVTVYMRRCSKPAYVEVIRTGNSDVESADVTDEFGTTEMRCASCSLNVRMKDADVLATATRAAQAGVYTLDASRVS